MTRIALVGAEGAGKSALAQSLATALSELDKGSVAVIDDYVDEISKETDLALGHYATYLGNLYIVLGRATRERLAAKDHEIVITCGTLIETSVFSAFEAIGLVELHQDKDLASVVAMRVDAMMRMLATLYIDTFHYDKVFYLPVASEDEIVSNFDKQIQTAIQAFQLTPTIVLLSEHEDPVERLAERTKQVLEALELE